MKTLVCIERIGGISGKRICVRLVSGIVNIYSGMFGIWFPKKSNTLSIASPLLDEVLRILDFNKRLVNREEWNYGNIEVQKDYLLVEIEYKEGEIINLTSIGLGDSIKYLEGERK